MADRAQAGGAAPGLRLGANGSGRERTIEVTETIGRHATLRTMPHLTCAGRPVDQLRG
ncbi:MAG TPA: hypothetical protein VK020_14375 [Microlunatus sp.]|nr:hypothetical protein [Microlunatus sp.]